MAAAFDWWMLAAVLTALALLASLRLSVPGADAWCSRSFVRYFTNASWLVPCIFLIDSAIGMMLQGNLSPWPPQAGVQMAQRGGQWAGATGFLTVLIVDLWLLWTPSQVARRYARPKLSPAMRMLPALNLSFGIAFLGIVAVLRH